LTANFTLKAFEIILLAYPTNAGEVSGGGTYSYGEEITVHAVPDPIHSFVNWTEDGIEVSKDADYQFIVTSSRTLTANFDKAFFNVIAKIHPDYDTPNTYTEGSGMYEVNTLATVTAFSSDCYRFKNWTIDDEEISTDNPYAFIVTGNVTLIANFYALDFDTYSPTLWNNTFMLDLNKLAVEGYDVIGCKWYKNDVEELNTRTIDEFSYSAGPKATDLLEPAPTTYSFMLITRNRGDLCSTLKSVNYNIFVSPPADNIWAHPNPVLAGTPFTVEGVAKDDEVRVYNQYGMCVHTAVAGGESIVLTLNVQAGAYVVRAGEKWVKVVIVR
jgi:hypothetical protein